MTDKIELRRAENTTSIEQDWGALTWFANKELGNSDDMTVGRCILKPGAANPPHHHPNCSEVLVVVQGRIRHTIDTDEAVEMDVGDTVSIPPNIAHRARNTGDEDAVLFIAFSSADRRTVGE